MYLLGVMSSDKTSEMTLLKTLRTAYQDLPSSLPSDLASLILQTALAHHTRRFENPTYEHLISTLTSESTPPWSGPGSTASLGGPASRIPASNRPSAASPNLKAGANNAPPPMSLDDGTMAFRVKSGGGFLIPAPTQAPSRHAYIAMVEEVLGKYWNSKGCRHSQLDMPPDGDRDSDEVGPRARWPEGMGPQPVDWVYLVTPFVCCLSRPIAVFYAFDKLAERLSESGGESMERG